MAEDTITIQGKIGDPVYIITYEGKVIYSSHESSGKTFPSWALYESKWNFTFDKPTPQTPGNPPAKI
jgi:hypothetical protein